MSNITKFDFILSNLNKIDAGADLLLIEHEGENASVMHLDRIKELVLEANILIKELKEKNESQEDEIYGLKEEVRELENRIEEYE